MTNHINLIKMLNSFTNLRTEDKKRMVLSNTDFILLSL